MVFVTGATGLLGSHLLYQLLSSGHIVRALKRKGSDLDAVQSVFKQYSDGLQLWNKLIWVEGDVLESENLSDFIQKSSTVYHCAAMVSFHANDQDLLLQTNLKGTDHMASLCLEHGVRLCYVSSIAALGDVQCAEEIIDENTLEIGNRERSIYSKSKGESEKIVWKYIKKGLNAVIVCPSIILGAGMWNKSSARLYSTAAKGIPVYTKGMTGYVDVRDLVKVMIRLAEDIAVKNERFILNGGNYTFQELFTTIARANKKRVPFLYLHPWISGLLWRALAILGKISGKKPAFTRETARSSHRRSQYSSAKILTLYPDFQFYTLEETVEHIRFMTLLEA